MMRSVRIALGVACLAAPHAAFAASNNLHLDLDMASGVPLNAALKMILGLTALSLAPAVLLVTTSFLRISVVLTFLRNALGTQGMPPTQVLMGMALFLTIAIMAPIGTQFYEKGLGPYLDGKLAAEPAFEASMQPLRTFMLKQTRSKDLELFYGIAETPRPQSPEQVQLHLLVPAFVTSEMRTAFEMGFVLYIPFLLVDIVVASLLMAMGMVMVPPAMISMPIKIMLFVLADGWNMIVSSLVRSFA